MFEAVCLVGKVLATCQVNKEAFKGFIDPIWRTLHGIETEDVRGSPNDQSIGNQNCGGSIIADVASILKSKFAGATSKIPQPKKFELRKVMHSHAHTPSSLKRKVLTSSVSDLVDNPLTRSSSGLCG
ncbi:hypothetical protein ACOSQ4_023120 [Xanthoceras sorbifolium]